MTDQEHANWRQAYEIWHEHKGNEHLIISVLANLIGKVKELEEGGN